MSNVTIRADAKPVWLAYEGACMLRPMYRESIIGTWRAVCICQGEYQRKHSSKSLEQQPSLEASSLQNHEYSSKLRLENASFFVDLCIAVLGKPAIRAIANRKLSSRVSGEDDGSIGDTGKTDSCCPTELSQEEIAARCYLVVPGAAQCCLVLPKGTTLSSKPTGFPI